MPDQAVRNSACRYRTSEIFPLFFPKLTEKAPQLTVIHSENAEKQSRNPESRKQKPEKAHEHMKTKTEQRRVGARGGRKSLFSCFHRADKFCPHIQDEPGHASERKVSFSEDFFRFVTDSTWFVALYRVRAVLERRPAE